MSKASANSYRFSLHAKLNVCLDFFQRRLSGLSCHLSKIVGFTVLPRKLPLDLLEEGASYGHQIHGNWCAKHSPVWNIESLNYGAFRAMFSLNDHVDGRK